MFKLFLKIIYYIDVAIYPNVTSSCLAWVLFHIYENVMEIPCQGLYNFNEETKISVTQRTDLN